jgi:hypothetical protein
VKEGRLVTEEVGPSRFHLRLSDDG